MKAAIVFDFKKPLKIEEKPIPSPGHGQVCVQVYTCGVCHTDIHAAHGDWPIKPKLPFVPGHEICGRVYSVGEGVKEVKIGDRVGIAWLHEACGSCEYCTTGWETLCEKQNCTGYTVDGGYQEYMLANAKYVVKIPEKLSFVEASPILCAGVTTYKGLKELELKAGEWVAIIGIGGLGHMGIQYAKAMGYRVVAVGHEKEKLKLAKKLGAEIVVDYKDKEFIQKVKKQTGGVHGALVTAVSVQAFRQSLSLLRRKGIISLVGLPPGEFPAPIFDIVLNRFTIRGSIVGTRQDLKEALDFAAEGKVKSTLHLKEELKNINSVFKKMLDGKINGRVVLEMKKE